MSALLVPDEDQGNDPVLFAEAAFEPNSSDSRDALALELFPDEPVKRAKFRLAWDLYQQQYEEEARR